MSRSFGGTSSDLIDVGAVSASHPTAYSIACWIYPASIAAGNRAWFVGGVSSNALTIFRQEGGGLFAYHQGGGGFVAASEASALTANTWYRVGMTWDGTNIRLYRDGALRATQAASGTISPWNTENAIGYNRPYGTSTENFNGRIARVVWNYRTSGTTVWSLAEIDSRLQTRPQGPWTTLDSWYELHGGIDHDLTGNARALTVTGTLLANHPPCQPPFSGFWRISLPAEPGPPPPPPSGIPVGTPTWPFPHPPMRTA